MYSKILACSNDIDSDSSSDPGSCSGAGADSESGLGSGSGSGINSDSNLNINLGNINPGTGESEDLTYVRLAGQGDSKALEYIFNKYKNLVRSIARTYYIVCGEVEDIIQEGMIGLYKAVKDFRPDRNASFKGFAILCVKRQIISSIKASSRLKHTPLNNYISIDQQCVSDANIILADKLGLNRISNVEDIIIKREESKFLLERLNEELSPFEIKVIKLYFKGDSYSEMSAKLNKSEKSIDNAIQRVRRKMQKYNTD